MTSVFFQFVAIISTTKDAKPGSIKHFWWTQPQSITSFGPATGAMCPYSKVTRKMVQICEKNSKHHVGKESIVAMEEYILLPLTLISQRGQKRMTKNQASQLYKVLWLLDALKFISLVCFHKMKNQLHLKVKKRVWIIPKEKLGSKFKLWKLSSIYGDVEIAFSGIFFGKHNTKTVYISKGRRRAFIFEQFIPPR